jgi:hypothetical protein
MGGRTERTEDRRNIYPCIDLQYKVVEAQGKRPL